MAADFIFATEPHHIEGPNWSKDITSKTAIINNKLAKVDEIGEQDKGFCWILTNGIRLYSCYWSPNSTLQDYLDFLARLQVSIRSAKTQVLVTGDFNAHHIDWGSASCNKREEALSDLINSLRLVVCNTGNTPTFRNHNGTSIIDVTIATPTLATKITEWKVLDTISLSDHSYILFTISTEPPGITEKTWNSRKINCRKLEDILMTKNPNTITENLT